MGSCCDGGYIIIGETELDGMLYPWLLRIDSSGDTLWTKTFVWMLWTVEQTNDSGFVLASYACPGGYDLDAYLLKTNVLGDTLWSRCYDNAHDETARAVQQTNDSGYILAGESYLYDGNNFCDIYLVKTDSLGNMLWSKTYGGAYRDCCYSVRQTDDCGFILAGYRV
jgi:hypothetical protein